MKKLELKQRIAELESQIAALLQENMRLRLQLSEKLYPTPVGDYSVVVYGCQPYTIGTDKIK
jgi:hypothetical protein